MNKYKIQFYNIDEEDYTECNKILYYEAAHYISNHYLPSPNDDQIDKLYMTYVTNQ